MYKAKAIKYFSKPKGLADALNITPGAVSQWPPIIPEKQALRLDRITDGELKYDPVLYEGASKGGLQRADG